MSIIKRGALALITSACLSAGCAVPAMAAEKNWTAPAGKILAQALSDATMRAHPDLLSVTFHGVPPGMTDAYTMFAGSFPERIGNPDDPDDIDVTKKGITIIDPRWHRTKDTTAKFVVLMPLRDVHRENVGLIVYAFKKAAHPRWGEREYFDAALVLRDALQARISSYAALYAPAK